MLSNHLILCNHFFLLLSIFPSIKVFSNESALPIRWPKYWSFSLSITPSNEHSGLISFRIDWFDILADQGTLKSLLQHHSSKASVLWCSVFFMTQLSHLYITTGKTIVLIIQIFISKVMSLLCYMLVILYCIFESIIARRMDLKSFHHTRKIFIPICGDYCSGHFAIIQISNHYSVHLKFTLCHLYLNKIVFYFFKKETLQ